MVDLAEADGHDMRPTPTEMNEDDSEIIESIPRGNDSADDVAVESSLSAQESLIEPRTSFSSYLQSPIISISVGSGPAATTLTAHTALLAQASFFATPPTEAIDLATEDPAAVGSFLEYLYTGEYFPRKLAGQRTLERDVTIPAVDDSGAQLLRHARVYTLADRWGVGPLKALAISKIHCIESTARGEIAYARYVYAHTKPDDGVVRAPVANYWATRSHSLRAEADEEFRALCLEFPQFGYDVLSKCALSGGG